ncbi:MAG: ferrous iron transport protein A, partial [Gemmatimonadetes bacterium]|nr:ferrous iron transport protein A [Gemmatimonadota bacterium]
WAFREWESSYEVVVRPGTGGPRRFGDLLVCRSTVLAGQTTHHEGIPIVTAPAALISLAPHLGTSQSGRCFREACRLRNLGLYEGASVRVVDMQDGLILEVRGARVAVGAALASTITVLPLG